MVPFRSNKTCGCGAQTERTCTKCGRPVCDDSLCLIRPTGECFSCRDSEELRRMLRRGPRKDSAVPVARTPRRWLPSLRGFARPRGADETASRFLDLMIVVEVVLIGLAIAGFFR